MTASEIGTVAASATVVLGGIAALVRVIFKAVIAVRDNTTATKSLSSRVDSLGSIADHFEENKARLDAVVSRLEKLEAKILCQPST